MHSVTDLYYFYCQSISLLSGCKEEKHFKKYNKKGL